MGARKRGPARATVRAMTPQQRDPDASWPRFLALSDGELLAQCEFDRFRASGPGGQKRNVIDSAVRLRHRPTGLAAQATESRSQHENRARALRRLRLRIALNARAPVAIEGYRPSEALAQAVASGRGRGRGVGRRDARFLPAMAALFDLLEAVEWRVSEAAALLAVSTAASTAAVTRFLALDVEVLRAANERRRAAGLRSLRPRR